MTEPQDQGGWRPITPPTRPKTASNTEWMPATLGGWIIAVALLVLIAGAAYGILT